MRRPLFRLLSDPSTPTCCSAVSDMVWSFNILLSVDTGFVVFAATVAAKRLFVRSPLSVAGVYGFVVYELRCSHDVDRADRPLEPGVGTAA
jgi:hypothetical protein